MERLHPGAQWIFRLTAYIVLILLTPLLLIYAVAPIVWYTLGELYTFSSLSIFVPIFVWLLLVIIVGEIYARMSYNRWFYEMDNSRIKIEHGIIWKRYASIPYERVQNVDIHRGIIARICGFSTLLIHTAGYSVQGVEGRIPAVGIKDAEKIREFVIKKIKQSHKTRQGL